jgi:hypothetical protein
MQLRKDHEAARQAARVNRPVAVRVISGGRAEGFGPIRRSHPPSVRLAESCSSVNNWPSSSGSASRRRRTATTRRSRTPRPFATFRGGLGGPEDWQALAARAVAEAQTADSPLCTDEKPANLGLTTAVLALVAPGKVVVANAGVTGAYWLGQHRENILLTTDDSWTQAAIAADPPAEEAGLRPNHEMSACRALTLKW